MKTVKITPPEGYEIDKEKSTFDEIVFKKIDTEAKTWEEIQEHNRKLKKEQWYLTNSGNIMHCIASTYEIEFEKNHLPDERTAEKILALCKLYIIAEHYNDGWKLDFTNDSYKCYPTWDNVNNYLSIRPSVALSGTTPIFKSKQLLLEAYENNKLIFETALKP